MKRRDQAIANWQTLGDIPCDENDCIEQEFLHFEVGTNKFTIWQWFESEYDCSVLDNLMPYSHG